MGQVKNPVISIVVPVVDQPDMTVRCFNSIRMSTTLPFELIWVDNGSDKESREIIYKQVDTFSENCVVVKNKENLGFIKATNQGIALARGTYVVLLNNDTEVFPNWDRQLTKPLYIHKNVGAVGPITQSSISWQTPHKLNANLELGMPRFNESIRRTYWKKLHEKFWSKYINVTGMPLAFFCVAIRKSVFDTIGTLCDEMSIGLGDDDEFCMRLRAYGYEQWLSLSTFVYHAHRTTFKALKLGVESLHMYNERILRKKEAELREKLGEDCL